MKVNRMWAMFGKRRTLFPFTLDLTRKEVIRNTVRDYGAEWRTIRKRYGYTIEKVVVLRAEEFEELLRRAGE